MISSETSAGQVLGAAYGSLFSPPDMEQAGEHGAMCGHGALAAALGIPVMDAMQYLRPGWVNVPMMKAAITAAGRTWARRKLAPEGETAVIMIQFLGPWTEPGVPPAAACRYRHWIATRSGEIWDANWPEWTMPGIWKSRARQLLPDRSTGYEVWGTLLINTANAKLSHEEGGKEQR